MKIAAGCKAASLNKRIGTRGGGLAQRNDIFEEIDDMTS